MTTRQYVWLATCAVLTGVVAISNGPARAQAPGPLGGTTTRLTNNESSQTDPSISGSLVLWTDQRNGITGLDDQYYCDVADCAGTETQLTSAANAQRLGDVSGSRIAYTDVNGATRYVVVVDVVTGATFAANGTADQNPRLDGPIVAFERGPASAVNVYAVDVVTGIETAVATTDALELNPTVDGTRVVYERHATGASPGDIVLYDLSTGLETAIESSADDARRPDIDGDFVVYDVVAGTNTDIAVHNLVTGVTTRVTHPGNQRSPHVSGNMVSFDDDSAGDPNIGLYYIPSGTLQLVTTSTEAEFLNDISGNRVVYTRHEAGNLDIWMYEFEIPGELSQQIREILEFFDAAVADGTLIGSGLGKSAHGRLGALRNMLEAARDLIVQGNTADACGLLHDVLERTDGNPQPSDFVSGGAAAELAARVRALRTALGC